jgi:hypothetical protein
MEKDNRIFSSDVCIEGAMSLVASRGQQLPVILSSVGRAKVGQVRNLLLTLAFKVVPCRSSGSHRNPPK